MTGSEYNQEQINAIRMIRQYFESLSSDEIVNLKAQVNEYLQFRKVVSDFQKKHLTRICTEQCFTSESSACCNREGIATFFADVIINILISSEVALDKLEHAIREDEGGFKCVYLSETGCLWKLKPIVCEMFLCDHAKQLLASSGESHITRWEDMRLQEKRFTWPDKPVLFNDLEKFFLQAGMESPLMYFHKGPGLLMVKKRSGVE